MPRQLRLNWCFSLGLLANDRTTVGGPLPDTGQAAQLHELTASGVKIGSIARKLERSPGAICSHMSSFEKTPRDLRFNAKRLSRPSERLAFAHANSQSSRLAERGPKARNNLVH